MIVALYQVLRDHAQHERTLELQRDQQHFILGVTSHMANIAFDKHVQFAEQYITKMQSILTTLLHTGPTNECLKMCSDLADIRLSFRAWVTEDVQSKILPFEEALRKIGTREIALKDLQIGETRTRYVKEMYEAFASVLGLPKDDGTVDEELAPRRIMNHLQELLGVKELSRLRATLINEAVRTVESRSH